MAALPFPTIPSGTSANRPTTSSIGSIRFNTTLGGLEVYNGGSWIPFNATSPQTWREWFAYYVNASNEISDRFAQRDYIEQEMQGRFPGNYTVDLAGNQWAMIFDQPQDETWFNLKYS